jgi:LCP family protein required for cell wall assembly
MYKAIQNSPIKFGVAVFGILLLIVLGWYLCITWKSPLDPALDLPTVTPAEVVVDVDPTNTPSQQGTSKKTDTPEPTLTPTIEPVCDGPLSMTILVSGVASEEYTYGLADAIRVARVDFQKRKVTVLAFPRELWVEIPGIEDDTGVTHGLLNMSYFYGTEEMGYADGSGTGSSSLALTLQKNYGLQVDYYIAVNLSGFREIVDAIGGIDVYLDGDVYRGHYGPFARQTLFLKSGQHHLDGKEAEILVRQRLDTNPGTRMQYQTIVLEALAVKMLTRSGLKRLPALIDRLRDAVRTDLSPQQISKLVCLAEKIDPQKDVIYTQIPEKLLVDTRNYFAPFDSNIYSKVEKEEGSLLELMTEFQNGEWP